MHPAAPGWLAERERERVSERLVELVTTEERNVIALLSAGAAEAGAAPVTSAGLAAPLPPRVPLLEKNHFFLSTALRCSRARPP